MIKYVEIKEELGAIIIKKTDEDGKEWYIPNDPANSDYQAYLESLKEVKADEAKAK